MYSTSSSSSSLATLTPGTTTMGLSEKTSPEAVPRDEHADNKEATEHVDFEKPALGAEDVPMTSAYAGWSRNATIRKFWRLYLLGMSCSVGAL